MSTPITATMVNELRQRTSRPMTPIGIIERVATGRIRQRSSSQLVGNPPLPRLRDFLTGGDLRPQRLSHRAQAVVPMSRCVHDRWTEAGPSKMI